MPFVTRSSRHIIESSIPIENVFINEYLPTANGDAVRVYLYGLYLSSVSWRYDNSVEHFAKVLGLTEATVEEIFIYWQDKGLVRIISVNPLEIEYRSLKSGLTPSRGIYADFNAKLEATITRPITQSEFKQYYDFLETYHVEQDALISVIKHCVEVKSSTVGYRYILTVAKRLAFEGARTVKTVEAMLAQEALPKAKNSPLSQWEYPAGGRGVVPKQKKVLTHSYKKGEVGKKKFKDTNLDEVEI